jgi:hypothetical protein
MLHKRIQAGDIHQLHNFEYPTATARLAAGVIAEDVGKVAWQLDDDTFWVLKVHSPIEWVRLGNDGIGLTTATSAGVVELPTFTDNGDGTVTIGSGRYALYDNTNYIGDATVYTIEGATLSLTDNSANYILADYNSGLPVLTVVTSVPPANTTDSNRVPVFSLYRSGNDVHYFDWDHLSRGLAEKINQRLRRTDRFRIDNGLGLTETPTRVINIGSGQVWAGANLISLDSIDSTSPEVHFYYHTAGVWTRGNLSQYNNTQYDNGTNLVTLGNGKYAVNWIYRSVQQEGALYVTLGNGNYTLLEAQASKEPSKPVEIATQSVLVGRIIVLKDAATATQIDRVVDVTFGASSVVAHNDLSGIQGGAPDEYYHLTAAQYADIANGAVKSTSTKTANYLLTASDYTIRVDCSSGVITLTLPDAAANTGRIYVIKKVDASGNKAVIDANASQTIDGSLTAEIQVQYLALTLQSNGSNWDII